MQKSHKIDVIEKLLTLCYEHNKDALFIMSLMHQYEERGSLSKKQLEGLLLKAQKIKEIPAHQIAAVEAIVLKMPTRDKTPINKSAAANDPIKESIGLALVKVDQILMLYPAHKQVQLFRFKLNNNQPLSAQEQTELDKFSRLLLKK